MPNPKATTELIIVNILYSLTFVLKATMKTVANVKAKEM